MRFEFSGVLVYWRGPSPFHFVPVPKEESEEIHAMAHLLTYGWGVIPVSVEIGHTTFSTSLFPKDGAYLVPVKSAVRQAEKLELDDEVGVILTFGELR